MNISNSYAISLQVHPCYPLCCFQGWGRLFLPRLCQVWGAWAEAWLCKVWDDAGPDDASQDYVNCWQYVYASAGTVCLWLLFWLAASPTTREKQFWKLAVGSIDMHCWLWYIDIMKALQQCNNQIAVKDSNIGWKLCKLTNNSCSCMGNPQACPNFVK